MWTPRRETLVRLICVVFLTASPVFAETWVKAVTPRFTVISNGSERDARTVAADFERIRAVIAASNPSLRIDGRAQTIVVAINGAGTFDKLLPADKKDDTLIAGLFHEGWERNYVIVRLDFLSQAEKIAYHEYVHTMLRLNFTRLPGWLDEGLSDFYANTRFENDKVYIGAPSPEYLRLLQSQDPFPLKALLNPKPRSSDYSGPDKMRMFYAESWALTHYLTFGEGMGNGHRLNAY